MISRSLLALLLLTGAAHAAPVRLVDAEGTRVVIDGQLVTTSGVIEVRAGEADVPVDGPPVDVRLVAKGWWALPASVSVAGTELRVWKSGTLTGRAVVATGAQRPATFQAVVEVPPHAGTTSSLPRGTKFDCAMTADDHFSCELPATTLDLVFRSKGLTPQYRWKVEIPSGATRDVGTVRWQPGASIVVWLERDSAKAAAEKGARAILTRMTSGDPSATSANLAVPVAEAAFDVRGHAQLAPLSAGLYRLEVAAPGFARASISPIEVFEGSESVLRKPIVLEPPVRITLALHPALDFQGERWRVSFRRLPDAASPMSGNRRELRADESGEVAIEGESPGRFRATVSDADGNRLVSHEFQVTSAIDARQELTLERHPVEGTVMLGERPLAAEVIFGTADGAERLTLTSDDEGKFTGAISRLGRWMVEIRAPDRAIRTIRTVTLVKDEPVMLRLEDGQIAGHVVDEEGKPVRATIVVSNGPIAETHQTDAGGAFRIGGLAGSVRLKANASRDRESAALIVDVTGNKHVDDLTLRLDGRRDVQGRVVVDGQSLPGAAVSVYPESGGAVMRATTDLEGRFRVTVRDQESFVTYVVAAAGRTIAAFRRPAGEEATLALDAAGGEVLVLPGESDQITLLHNGARIPLQEVLRWNRANGRDLFDRDGNLTIANVARGTIRACAPTKARGEVCRDALLVPRGSVTLDLR
ncbi:MAG TPA: carboxypeptidase-like regulatory domain-containing protein [Thermoanaerobaculia bacterium]|nr:carboxypeptidase-like regulatory domain-containing protein [Thermoanaerobaculia bacterium]